MLVGLRTKRLTWEFLNRYNFFITLTSAIMPMEYLQQVLQEIIDEDIKSNPNSKLEIVIEHWWRVKGYQVGGE